MLGQGHAPRLRSGLVRHQVMQAVLGGLALGFAPIQDEVRCCHRRALSYLIL